MHRRQRRVQTYRRPRQGGPLKSAGLIAHTMRKTHPYRCAEPNVAYIKSRSSRSNPEVSDISRPFRGLLLHDKSSFPQDPTAVVHQPRKAPTRLDGQRPEQHIHQAPEESRRPRRCSALTAASLCCVRHHPSIARVWPCAPWLSQQLQWHRASNTAGLQRLRVQNPLASYQCEDQSTVHSRADGLGCALRQNTAAASLKSSPLAPSLINHDGQRPKDWQQNRALSRRSTCTRAANKPPWHRQNQ